MDFFDQLFNAVNTIGFSSTVSLALLVLLFMAFSMFGKRMKNLTGAITILTDKVSSPYLDVERSVMIFRVMLNEHIERKLKFIGGVLKSNSITNRRTQIEKNIASAFKTITKEEAEKLGKIKSVCGDMGAVLEEQIIWDTLLTEVFNIVFSKSPEHTKIKDLRTMLESYVNDLVKVIEQRGYNN